MNYTGKINLTKIEKQRLFKSESTGNIYLDIVLIETSENEYGQSHMIVQQVTKEEREKGIKGAILGNCKVIEKVEPVSAPIDKDDLPF